MAKVVEVKVNLQDIETDLWRTFKVNENIKLKNFAVSVLSTFNVEYKHYFVYCVNDKYYFPKQFFGETKNSMGDKIFLYDNYRLADILKDADSFILLYDMGESFKFNVTVVKREEVAEKEDFEIQLINGSGYGIVEDDKSKVDAFLNWKSKDLNINGLNENIKGLNDIIKKY